MDLGRGGATLSSRRSRLETGDRNRWAAIVRRFLQTHALIGLPT